ncbi:MAG TPA: hypothetical protein VMW25_02950, partial [Clostridia bacterium]|nr:hypothetical protein [Clostridia bacterium]
SYVNPKGSNYKQPIPGRVAGESWIWDESRNGYVYVETVGGENFPTGPSHTKGGKTVAYTNINTIEGYAKRGLR